MLRLLVVLALFVGCDVGRRAVTDAAEVEVVQPLITDLRVSPVPLVPAFSDEQLEFQAQVDGDGVTIEVDVAPAAQLTINGRAGTTRALFVPVGGLEIVVRAQLGTRVDERRVSVSRTGWLAPKTPLTPTKVPPPPLEPPEFGGSRGFATPVLSPSGEFAAVSFMDEFSRPTSIEVFRLSGPEVERITVYEQGLQPLQFCARSECLWLADHRFGPEGEDREELVRLTWDSKGTPSVERWVVPPDTDVSLLVPDAPAEIVEYTIDGVATRRLLGPGVFGPRTTVPSLRWGSQMTAMAVSADRRWFVHGDPHGGAVTAESRRAAGQVVVFHREVDTGVWVEQQRFDSPVPKEESYGRSLLLSDDATVLFVGVPTAVVNDLDNAGLVQRYERVGDAFSLSRTIVSPDPEVDGYFGGFLVGRPEVRSLTFTGRQPWRAWYLSPAGEVSAAGPYPTTLGGLRISSGLDVAIGIRNEDPAALRQLVVWR